MECRKVFSSTIHSKPLPVWLWSTTTIYWLRNPSSMKSLKSPSSISLAEMFELGHPAVEILSKWLPQSSYFQINTSFGQLRFFFQLEAIAWRPLLPASSFSCCEWLAKCTLLWGRSFITLAILASISPNLLPAVTAAAAVELHNCKNRLMAQQRTEAQRPS